MALHCTALHCINLVKKIQKISLHTEVSWRPWRDARGSAHPSPLPPLPLHKQVEMRQQRQTPLKYCIVLSALERLLVIDYNSNHQKRWKQPHTSATAATKGSTCWTISLWWLSLLPPELPSPFLLWPCPQQLADCTNHYVPGQEWSWKNVRWGMSCENCWRKSSEART